MDLIYTDSDGKDLGVIQKFYLDYEENTEKGKNTFEVQDTIKDNVLAIGNYIYMDGTEYGGRVDSIKIDTSKSVVYAGGRTWRGILESKILEPASGADYYTVSGDLNAVLAEIITKVSLGGLFSAESTSAGLTVTDWQFYRYTDAYSGIIRLLASNGYKLSMTWSRTLHKVVISAVPIVDYSSEGEITSDMFDFTIKKTSASCNHMIGLGQGDLAARQVVHKYVDADGNITDTQYYTGMDEIVEIYDYSNAESLDDLAEKTAEQLETYACSEELDVKAEDITADIGDRFAAFDANTYLSVVQYVTSKIVTFDNSKIEIKYEVGDIL